MTPPSAAPAADAGASTTLDPLLFPLRGSQLIEASAGTGKTYTIAALYVRLVLRHGTDEHRFARALTPPEILVVTFTEAATKELRDRIRARLATAAEYFQLGFDAPSPRDDFLATLRNAYPAAEWPACAYRLQLAAEWMDEAAVSTIHGWCNRMLREHAFDSGSLFTQKLEADQSELLAETVRDYWRTFIAPLAPDAAAEVANRWAGPAAFQKSVKDLVGLVEFLHVPGQPPLPATPATASAAPLPPEPAAMLRAALDARARTLAALKRPWAAWPDELKAELDQARAAKAFNGQKLKQNHYDEWLQALRAWRDDPSALRPALSDAARARLSTAGMEEIWNAASAIPEPLDHPAFAALAALESGLSQLADTSADLLRHAAAWIAVRFAVEQERRAQMGFDELLTRLDAALHGANGERLAARIRDKFPVALIDEFQDTDPVQYRIFDAVYRVRENCADTALVLIGDPKQAIYAFRGADIDTYLAARRACDGRLHTLARNFRSTPAMVAAVNRCFGAAEARASGDGAFLFRSAAGNPIPFIAADAEGRRDAFTVEGSTPAALTLWSLPARADGRPTAKESYLADMGAACATEMVRLLNLGQAGKALFAEEGGSNAQPLRPRDMAVLVNNRYEADAIRAALAARDVRSVYLSDRDSVYASAQAEEMQRWLAACAEPDDGRLLRAALATATLDLSWEELERLNRDELAAERRVLQFRGYRQTWRRQGVLPMLRHLLQDFGVPARLLGPAQALGSGERVLTDLLHLAELLQKAAAELDGEPALIRHLAEQRAATAKPGGVEDARLVRLESDADLVQVVTVYKSKGLEYPLVFLPFACTLRAVAPDAVPLKLHDDAGKLQVLLSADARAAARADRERLGEDLRKLYVALTRARHATWVGLAPTRDFADSAFGHLLDDGAAVAAGQLGPQLDALADGCPAMAVAPAPPPDAVRFAPEDRGPARGSALIPARPAREHWWIASYSALRTTATDAYLPAIAAGDDPVAGRQPVPDTAREDTFREDLPGAPARPRTSPPAPGSMHAFPRGAEVGTFLHDLLEWAATTGFAEVAARGDLLRDSIARRCARRGWNAWIDPLTAWAQDFLQAKFALPASAATAAASLRLATLAGAVPEMEFWLAAGDVDTAELDRLVREHTLDGAARPALAPANLNGMLKGFVDLVFEHDGRYFVADYKSNWLGPDDAAYSAAAMREAILASRYELQYVLYLLALHRLLAARLPDYDYDRHVGGAVYLFLRGSRAPGGGVHFERPPRALIETLDRRFAQRAAGAATPDRLRAEVSA